MAELAESFLKKNGIDVDAAKIKELMSQKIDGGYMVIRGRSCIINAEETALIHQAIKEAGGVVRNWSNRL